MATPGERAGGIRDRLNERANGLSGRTQARADDIRGRLNQRKAGKIVQDLIDMSSPEREPPTLRREEPKGGIPARRGYAEKNLQPGQGIAEGGGIASPLVEGAVQPEPPSPGEDTTLTPARDREYHPTGLYYSTDYTLAVQMRPLKTLTMRDANGAEVELIFAKPEDEDPI